MRCGPRRQCVQARRSVSERQEHAIKAGPRCKTLLLRQRLRLVVSVQQQSTYVNFRGMLCSADCPKGASSSLHSRLPAVQSSALLQQRPLPQDIAQSGLVIHHAHTGVASTAAGRNAIADDSQSAVHTAAPAAITGRCRGVRLKFIHNGPLATAASESGLQADPHLSRDGSVTAVNGINPAARAASNGNMESSTHAFGQPASLLWTEDDVQLDSFGMDVGGGDQAERLLSQQAAVTMLPQQQQMKQMVYHRHSRYQRQKHQHMQQQTGRRQGIPGHNQQFHPVLHSGDYVGLLHQTANIRSWSAAHRFLQQQHNQLQQAHIGMLWSQMLPKLQQQHQQYQARAWQPMQQQLQLQQQRLVPENLQVIVQQVMQQLCQLSCRHAGSFTSQSLACVMQGLTAAMQSQILAGPAAASRHPQAKPTAVPAAPAALLAKEQAVLPVQLPAELPELLWLTLLALADSCTPHQLALCLAGGRMLGWHLGSSTAGSSSSVSASAGVSGALAAGPFEGLSCQPVLAKAMQGQVGYSLRGQGEYQCSSVEAGQLLHAIASYTSTASNQQHSVPEAVTGTQQWTHQEQHMQLLASQWQQQLPWVQELQCLAGQACQVLSPVYSGMPQLGEGMSHVYSPHSNTRGSSSSKAVPVQANSTLPPAAAAAASASATSGGRNFITSSQSSSQSSSSSNPAVMEAVCVLQSVAALQLTPSLQHLESLIEQLEPHVPDLHPQQLVQLLQALTCLPVEPWPSWLEACYSKLENNLQMLQPQQLVLLLQLLPHIRSVQPSQALLHRLAKITAAHCCRYNWQQLTALPLAFTQVGFRPQPYWLKDYVMATSTRMKQHQLQQQQWQQQQQPSVDQQHVGAVNGGQQPQQEQLQADNYVQHQLLQQHCSWRQQAHQLLGMLVGVAWLAPAKPLSTWVHLVERQLLACLTGGQRPHTAAAEVPAATARASRQTNVPASTSVEQAVLGQEDEFALLQAFARLGYTPSMELQQALGASSSSSGDEEKEATVSHAGKTFSQLVAAQRQPGPAAAAAVAATIAGLPVPTGQRHQTAGMNKAHCHLQEQHPTHMQQGQQYKWQYAEQQQHRHLSHKQLQGVLRRLQQQLAEAGALNTPVESAGELTVVELRHSNKNAECRQLVVL